MLNMTIWRPMGSRLRGNDGLTARHDIMRRSVVTAGLDDTYKDAATRNKRGRQIMPRKPKLLRDAQPA